MSIILTFWEDAQGGNITGEDFDGILEIRLKSVKQIPDLIAAHRFKNCTMISTEYSGNHEQRGKITNPNNPRRFKEIWRKGQPLPETKLMVCPLCGARKDS